MKKLLWMTTGFVFALVLIVSCGKNPLLGILSGDTATASTGSLVRKVYTMEPGTTEITISELTLNDMPIVQVYCYSEAQSAWRQDTSMFGYQFTEGKFSYPGNTYKMKIVVIK